MSADLLAAFGSPQTDSVATKTPSNAKTTSTTKKANAEKVPEEQPWILQTQPLPVSQRQDNAQPLWKQDGKGTDVLFDASEDDQDEDDFGEFEAAPVTDQTKTQLAPHPVQHEDTDLLGLDNFLHTPNASTGVSPPGLSYRDGVTVNAMETESLGQHRFGQRERYSPQSKDRLHRLISSSSRDKDQRHQQSLQESAYVDDEWGNFEDAEPELEVAAAPITTVSRHVAQTANTEQHTDEDDWDSFDDGVPIPATTVPLPLPQSAAAAAAAVVLQPASNSISTPTPKLNLANPPSRPTNIPPPSSLLQLLPKAYNTLSQQSRQPNPAPKLAQHALQIYTTTARLIAGRTHRWKRDTHLSQSTRISQAGLKNTGMKLTALDKSESIKEDQEAQEAILSWQRHAATLNAVMLKGKVHKPPMTLDTSMAVRSANGLGVLTARDCCAVCGLKRNERVTGIDVRVEDTFGEFWVEHWGHRDCCEFWYRYEGLLDRR